MADEETKESEEKPKPLDDARGEAVEADELAELNPEEVAKAEILADFSDDGKIKDEKTDYGLVRVRVLENEMRESYLDYAMSVIISRALPDVRDGLKPVHRRVLFSMNELGLTHQAKHRKSATVVGDVLGKYHPHGDIAVYDTLVRLAQDFSMGVRLVDGQGNFGSVDGDQAAAMRYTECRLTAAAEELLSDIDKNTVDFVPNYDGTRQEPKVLPGKLPNLLLNGSMGIAVGMATNIPPHNLGEVCDAAVHLIDNPECTIDDLMGFVKGPDFPTGAEIYGLAQIKNAYGAGKGAIVMRAVANIEETKRGFRIIVTEIPYQVNKAELISKIADLVKEKKLDGISDLRDESDRKDGVRIVIELRSNAYPKKILNRLYELTAMQTTFYVNMLALVDGIQPRVLTLKNILEEYVKHRKVVVKRRTQFELDRAKERAHILEGLRIALKNIDDVVATIRRSANREEAQKALIKKFKLDEIQANAILEMRLSALAALEREKVEQEYQEKLKLIASLEEILKSEEKILEIIKKELTELKNKFPIPRRTKIYEQELGKFSAEDLIPSEQVIIILTRGNYIKRMPVSAYKSQVRGGKGVMGMETREEDMIEHLIVANTHDDIYFFTDRGRVFHTKVYEIPSASRIAKGQAIVNILQISPDEKVTSLICMSQKDMEKYKFIMMATNKGLVKKTTLAMYSKVRKTGILAMKLKGDDRLRWVKFTKGNSKIFQVSARGQSILYEETDIRAMGRTAAGVRGINLRANDYVVSTDVVSPEREADADALIVLEKGLGKRTPLPQFKTQLRGGMGLRAAAVTERTGPIVGMRLVYGEAYDVILASSKGQLIRMSLASVKKLQRDTQGVRLIKLNTGDKVTSVTVIKKDISDKLNLPDEPKGVDDNDSPVVLPVVDVPEKLAEDVETKIEKVSEKPKAPKDVSKKKVLLKKEQPKETKEDIPEWAKAHADSWRQPGIFKPRQDIKINDYSTSRDNKDDDLPNLFSKKPSEPNYWGKEG
jgi:DNA gyrase subunit A